MQKTAEADIVIIGGGIAGLWLLNRLRQAGYSAFLFESGTLGGGQTHKSQGIIHGGLKYALQGVWTHEAQSLIDMPKRWKDCLKGDGEIDLSAVPILSSEQYLWAPNKFTSRLAGFFASAALSSKVSAVDKNKYPLVFQHENFKGEVFSLDEMVLDVPVLVRELVKANQDAIFKIEPLCVNELKWNDQSQLVSATVYVSGKSLEVKAQQFIFTAGAGNEVIIKKFKQNEIAMQRRPLHMVLVKVPVHYSLYAHCIGLGSRPRVTITTHHIQDGNSVWYLGGALAEEGVKRNTQQQIKAARSELAELFPWLDFSTSEWTSFMVDRAEPLHKSGLKPDSSYFRSIENLIIAWPTKLALAPQLSDEIMRYFEKQKMTHQLLDTRELRSWPIPPLARPIWEELFCKNVA